MLIFLQCCQTSVKNAQEDLNKSKDEYQKISNILREPSKQRLEQQIFVVEEKTNEVLVLCEKKINEEQEKTQMIRFCKELMEHIQHTRYEMEEMPSTMHSIRKEEMQDVINSLKVQ